jgi:hypothetical protein
VVFIITAVVYVIGALGFIILGQGETQEWATNKPATLPVTNSDSHEEHDDEKEKFELK